MPSKGVSNCTWKSTKQRSERRNDEHDDDDRGWEGGGGNTCNARNRLGTIAVPIIVDSGASASTLPTEWCQHVRSCEATGPTSGQGFHVANGEEIPNL